MKTTHTGQMSLASSPLQAGSSTTKNEILLGSCWDPVPVRAPRKLGGKTIAELIFLSIPCPRARFYPKSTSTGSTEQIHLRAVHVCMLWAAVAVAESSNFFFCLAQILSFSYKNRESFKIFRFPF